MLIDFDSDTIEITSEIKHVEGYLECEKIIIHNIKKVLGKGCNDKTIIVYLKNLFAWLDKKIQTDRHNAIAPITDTPPALWILFLKMPYWKSWMKTIVM